MPDEDVVPLAAAARFDEALPEPVAVRAVVCCDDVEALGVM
jgi:hypothetical protein